jgi:hypothetical protein
VTPKTLRLTRLVFLGFLLLYGVASLRAPAEWRLLDAVNLAIHETGHLVFAPFGEFLGYLGGTLLQLLFPAAFVVYFARRRERFGAAVALWWVAQNCWNVSVYVADARRQALPLVGGGEHDWAYLLGELGWLARDAALARTVHAVGVLLFAWALVNGFRAAMAASPPPVALPSAPPPADSKIAQS